MKFLLKYYMRIYNFLIFNNYLFSQNLRNVGLFVLVFLLLLFISDNSLSYFFNTQLGNNTINYNSKGNYHTC